MQLNPYIETIAKHYIQSNAGYRAERYLCSEDKWTIGFGHLIFPGEVYDIDGYKISLMEADMLFDIDFMKHAEQASWIPFFEEMPPLVQIVLIDMVFQMGIGLSPTKKRKGTGVRGFVNTLRFLKNRQWNKAANGIANSRYAKQTPVRAAKNAVIVRAGWDIAAVPILRIAGLNSMENAVRMHAALNARNAYQMEMPE